MNEWWDVSNRERGLTGLRMRDAGERILHTYIKALWLYSWTKKRSISHFSNLKRNYIYDHFCLCSWWVKCKYWISFLQISNIQYHLLWTFCSSWWGQSTGCWRGYHWTFIEAGFFRIARSADIFLAWSFSVFSILYPY